MHNLNNIFNYIKILIGAGFIDHHDNSNNKVDQILPFEAVIAEGGEGVDVEFDYTTTGAPLDIKGIDTLYLMILSNFYFMKLQSNILFSNLFLHLFIDNPSISSIHQFFCLTSHLLIYLTFYRFTFYLFIYLMTSGYAPRGL